VADFHKVPNPNNFISFSKELHIFYDTKVNKIVNRVLRRIFGAKGDEVTGDWRILHNEELHNLYSSPNITRMIKSSLMTLAGHVARMGRRGMHIGYWSESQKERDQ
jgi:hypothetical protein